FFYSIKKQHTRFKCYWSSDVCSSDLEPYTRVLSRYLIMPLPDWVPKSRTSDNWQTSAWEIRSPAPDQPFQKCLLKQRPTPARVRSEERHVGQDERSGRGAGGGIESRG